MLTSTPSYASSAFPKFEVSDTTLAVLPNFVGFTS